MIIQYVDPAWAETIWWFVRRREWWTRPGSLCTETFPG